MNYKNFITAPKSAFSSSSFSGDRSSCYKEGVKPKYLKKGPPTRVQIMPAFNTANPTDPQGWSQCLENGAPTQWFGMVKIAKFVGHGDWRDKVNVLSLDSFDGSEPCPYNRVFAYAKNSPDWKYLVEKQGKFGAPGYQDATLTPAKSILLLNVVDIDNPGAGVQLMEAPFSIANSLLNEETGVVFQRNLQLDNYPNAAEALASNPMLAYANGDITDPRKAPVFSIELQTATTGKFGVAWTIRIDVQNGQVLRRTATDFELASRHHLENSESFLDVKTGQEIVDRLASVLRGHRNANGIDETCLLKEAVGDTYRVDTVSAPGAVGTVQGATFTAPATQAATVAQPQVQQVAPQVQQVAPQVQQVAPAVAVAAPPPGFPQNPALAAQPQATPQVQSSVSAIPGEMSAEEDRMAAALAERIRQQLKLRQ